MPPGSRAPTIGAVVVAYESHAVLPPLLASFAVHEPDVPVVVVDNDSPSGTPPVPDDVELIRLGDNRGYGAAANVGAARLLELEARHLAFLNPDIRLDGRSLSEIAAKLTNLPKVGVASGPVRDSEGHVVHSALGPNATMRALWFTSGWQSRRTRMLIKRLLSRGVRHTTHLEDALRIEGHVLGGVMVITADCFEDVGGFDEDYFLYWEDADICERVRRAGAEIRIVDCRPFVHAPTTSTPGVADEQRWTWYVEGARTFAQKHLPAGQASQLDAALALGRRLRDLRAHARE
ncbi:MAG: glycosyltransferase family 2 protein [Actinobacteria bacterium]|nr:glycosyltransferase family 2 protein [Actinomycetota bacterium]